MKKQFLDWYEIKQMAFVAEYEEMKASGKDENYSNHVARNAVLLEV